MTDRFQVRPPTLAGVTATDGTGRIEAGTTAAVGWTLVPTDAAAPNEPVTYSVGGQLSYTQDGVAVVVPIQSVPLTVLPNPQLVVNYFHQRDVFSDDPFTNVVESSQPYSLAVLIRNDGAGAAKNLTITSAQPKIVDNEKGLLVDFRIVGTEVQGQNLSPSLTANFGTIAPGESAIGRWLLTSSLQGHFVDYDATFQHVDGLGDPRLSIIKSVNIHEMLHIVDARENGDTLPDFLTNENPQVDTLPDTVWFSNSTTAAVTVAANVSVSGAAANGMTLSANASSGY